MIVSEDFFDEKTEEYKFYLRWLVSFEEGVASPDLLAFIVWVDAKIWGLLERSREVDFKNYLFWK